MSEKEKIRTSAGNKLGLNVVATKMSTYTVVRTQYVHYSHSYILECLGLLLNEKQNTK